jgi:hypothetical protein
MKIKCNSLQTLFAGCSFATFGTKQRLPCPQFDAQLVGINMIETKIYVSPKHKLGKYSASGGGNSAIADVRKIA